MAADIDELQIKIAADSQSASENVLALAGSLESLATSAIAATEPLKNFSQALNSLKGFKATGITQTADDLSKAFGQFNNIGTIDNAVQIIDSIENLRDAMSGLSDISANTKEFKVSKGFTSSIEQLATALPKLSGVGNVSDSVAVLDSVENLEQATSGLRNISENIRSLKIGTSFDKNLEQLSLAMAHLNEIGDTSAFAGGVEAISQSIERLNNIEIGQGFINLVQASSQWADALSKLNDIKLGTNFSEGIARVARAAEILNDVDFSGFKRMNDALASLPDNVRISFGASSTEVQELTEHLVNLNNTVQSIQTNIPQKRHRNTDTSGTGTNAPAIEKPDYSWSNDEIKGTLERASAFNKEVSDIKKVLAAYETMGEQVPESVIRTAESLGVFNNAMDETAGNTSAFRDKLKDVSNAVATGAFKALGAEIKLVMSPLTAIGRKFKAASEKAGQFISSIKRIAMYRAIRSILKAITEGFEEGRKNLYYYSQAVGTDFAPSMDKAATAALYLKNSIGAATAPLTNYLVPMIDKAVDHIVELINKFNELTAVLTKQSTWTKAIKYPTTWQDSLEDAEKSAKKLKSTMLGFDELNIIEFSEPTVKKNGFDAEDYSKMFEEVKTDMTVGSKIPELLMPIKLAWDSQGDKTLKTIKKTWSEIRDLIGAVGDSFSKVWTNGTGQKSLELILQIVQNIVGTFGELASGIRKAWEENETGTRIIQATWDIANNLLTVFRDIWGSLREWASGLNWSPLLDALAGLGEALERLTDPNGALARLAKSVFDKVLLPIGKWLIEKGLPSAVDLLTTAFDGLAVVLEFLEPLMQKVIDFCGKIAGFTFSNITGLADGFTSFMDVVNGKDVSNSKAKSVKESNDKLVDALGGKDSWYGKFNKKMQDAGSHGLYDFFTIDLPKSGEMWSEILHGTEDQKGIFGQIGDAFKDIWNDEVKNAFGDSDVEIISESSIAKFGTNVKEIQTGYKKIGDSASDVYSKTQSTEPAKGLSGAFEKLKTEYQDFSDVWGSGVTSMSNGWNGFVEGIQTKWQTFKDDWASGMTGISTAATGTWESIKSFFSDGWESIKTGASDTWENVKTFFSDGWESIKDGIDTFGENWSIGWQSMKDSVSSMWENAKSDFESGWQSVMDGVDNFKKSFSTGLSTIKKTVKDTWSSVTSTLSSKWDDFKGFVSDYRSNWKSGFEEIQSSVSESWDKIKSKIGDSFAWQSLKQNIADYAGEWFDKFIQIKGTVSDTSQKIYNDLSEWIGKIKNAIENSAIGKAVSDIKDNIVETVGKIWGDDNSGIKGTFKKIADGLSSFIGDLFDGNHLGKIGNQLKDTLNSVISMFETAVNWIIKGLNFFVENVNDALDIHIDIPNWVPGIGGNQFTGFSLPEIPEFSFYKFEKGGFPDKGSLFMANEVGNPELVGKIGNQTAVVNNQQIVKAVSEGVFNAVVSAMSKTSSSNDSSKNEIHIYLDRQEITAQVEQQQRDNGVSIMSGLVYT